MNVLVIAPHADDENIGMGRTIAKFAADGKKVRVAVVTGHGSEPHPIWPRELWERVRLECRAAMEILGCGEPLFRELPAACLDVLPAYEINKVVADLIAEVQSEEIYVRFAFHLHKDHGAITYAVAVGTRPYTPSGPRSRRVFAYETLSETHLAPPYLVPAFQPNVFIDTATRARKSSRLARLCQPDNPALSAAALRSLAHQRGTHFGISAAEGFVLRGEYHR